LSFIISVFVQEVNIAYIILIYILLISNFISDDSVSGRRY